MSGVEKSLSNEDGTLHASLDVGAPDMEMLTSRWPSS
jgi:hypothetical protein